MTDTSTSPRTGDGASLAALPVLPTHVDTTAPMFRENATIMRALVAELRERLQRVAAGGGPEATARHRARGKMLARERIDRLVDTGTPFLELSPLAAWGMYDDDAPAAGIVTGIGAVCGRE